MINAVQTVFYEMQPAVRGIGA